MVRPALRRRSQRGREPGDALRVEPGGGLIQQQNRRFVQQRASDGHALAHPARKGTHQRIAALVQTDFVNKLVDALGGVGISNSRAKRSRFSLAVSSS